jgi:hypothetical protein
MPWLLSEMKQEIKQMISSREILTGLSLFAQDDYLLLQFSSSFLSSNTFNQMIT